MGDVENKDQRIDGRTKKTGDGRKESVTAAIMEKMTLCETER